MTDEDTLPKLVPLGDHRLRLILDQVKASFPNHKFSYNIEILKDGQFTLSLVQVVDSQAQALFSARGVGDSLLEATDQLAEHTMKSLDMKGHELRAELKRHTERQEAILARLDAASGVLAENAIE